jgi:hypothetical protein
MSSLASKLLVVQEATQVYALIKYFLAALGDFLVALVGISMLNFFFFPLVCLLG